MSALSDCELVKRTVFLFLSNGFSNCAISTIVSTTAVALAARPSLAPSTSSGVLVTFGVTAPSASVCLRYDGIRFVCVI